MFIPPLVYEGMLKVVLIFLLSREKFPRCTKENDGEVQSLPRAYRRDRKLRYSIGACENIPHSLQPPVRVRPTGRATGTDKTEVYPDISNSISAPGDVSKSSDVNDEHLSMEGVQKSTGQVPCVSVSPKYRPLISTAVSGKEVCVHSSIDLSEERLLRRQKAIHRSQSDLSSRHSRSSADFSDLSSRVSRTSVELERFFNEMGLDKTVIDPMLRKQSQSFSEFDLVEGMSSLGSPDARSNCSGVSKSEKTDHTGPEGGEKPISSTSVVERNARIIKWLCNVKKARNMAASTEKAETS